MRLLLDEQISGRVASPLRERGHDVLAVSEEASLRGLGDRDLFEVAQEEERAVVTFNVADFIAIAREFAREDRPHHGVVFVNSSRLPNSDFGGLIAALAALLESPPRGESLLHWLQPSG